MAKPPAGYSLQRGAYFTDDGQGPYSWDGTTMTLLGSGGASAGNAVAIAQFDAEYAEKGFQPYVVSSVGGNLVLPGPCVFGSIRCVSVGGGSITGWYDATSATGTNLMPSKTFTANETFSFVGDDANSDDNEGVLFDTGVYLNISVGGTYEVWLRPAVAAVNTQASITAWNKYVVTADGNPTGLNAPCRLRGMYCITAGTMAGVYDAAGVLSGTNIAPTSPTAALGKLRFGKRGGRPMSAGCWLDWTSGSFLVLAAPQP